MAIVLIAAVIVGWHKGAIRQVGSVAAVVGALVVCRTLGPLAVPLVGSWLGVDDPSQGSFSDYSATMLAYAALFMLTWLIVWLLTRMLHQAIRLVHLGVIDKIGGALFLLAKWALVASMAMNLLKVVQPDAAVFAAAAPGSGWQAPMLDAILAFAPWLWGCLGINL
ncbi:MAG: CvpA family protein [Alloprevotella sp.]|nr:CvpA family protein [Alloprevotella sp.]